MQDIRLSSFCPNPDGKSDNTKEIQEALNEAGKKKARLIFEAGKTYRSGMLIIPSDVELHFEKGSLLMMSDDMSLLDPKKAFAGSSLGVPSYLDCEYNGQPTLFFLYAKDGKNISITGEGAVDGNEKIFYGETTGTFIDGAFYPRVPLLFFENIENVKIEDITFQRSAFWTTHLVGCRKVYIHRLKVKNNLLLANCDAIDPDHCQNVLIEDCDLICADDAIVFKTTEANQKYGPCQNIQVRNCRIQTTSAGIKFGTESWSDFAEIFIRDIDVLRCNRGISFQLRDQGNIHRIHFKNIKINSQMFDPKIWWGKSEPIAVTAVPRTPTTKVGTISDVVFENIESSSENGIYFYGDAKGDSIHDITFKNVHCYYERKTDWPNHFRDLRPGEGWGVYEEKPAVMSLHHVRGIDTSGLSYQIDPRNPFED